jgi:uncharacterized protein YndB with AHSA1/START domain
VSEDQVTVEMEIAAPPERVFDALVDQKQLAEWWGKEPSVELTEFRMDGRKGGRWGFKAKPVKGHYEGPALEQLRASGAAQFEAHGEVLELVRPRLLVWSWIANYHQDPKHATTVRWELEPTKKGTRVRVTHSGLAREPIARKDYEGGWVGVLRLLNDYLANAA